MFALHSRHLRRRISAPTSGSARRRARERRQAEQTRAEGERLAKENRELRAREKKESQRQMRESLASFEPWGRAGGGAPNARGVRYSDLRAGEIYPEDELKGVSKPEGLRRWVSPRRRRRRAPVRLREDPQLCYAETLRNSVDNDIRYRQTPDNQKNYKEVLDDMVARRKKASREERKRDLEYERMVQTMAGPWGRPGPGGTTWRNPRDIGLNFSKSMGWTDNEIFNKMKGDQTNKLVKKSSLTLPQVKRDDDTPDKEKPSSVEKLPSIKMKTPPQADSRETKVPQKPDEAKSEKPEREAKRSPRKKFVKRLPNGEKVKRIVPDENDNNIIVSDNFIREQKLTPEETILRLTGGIELVPLLARRRRLGARTLPSSDVTRPPEQSCEWRYLNMDYLKDLKHQMKIKCEQKEERRLDSAESVRVHHETWATLWGRPGHGAPQQRGRYARNNLARLLYVKPLQARCNI